VALTPDEATIGEPYVSDDIGSYLGPPPTQTAQDPPDLYDRWVQFGTFQPILRLHSDNLDRLPWEFPEPVSGITESFLRLREALIPYTYTLAYQAYAEALPIAQPLYLQYPDEAEAYSNPEEYLYGSDVLVAPVLSPGSDPRTTVWFPPGRWVDYFTGATFQGPATETMSVPLDRTPVFVRAGGVVPEQQNPSDPQDLDIKVYAGSSGSFDLYDDSGTGLGYEIGQYTETEIRDSVGTTGTASGSQTTAVSIAAATGHYPGEEKAHDYEVELVDLSQPSQVTLNGEALSQTTQSSKSASWYYSSSTHTLAVSTGSQLTTQSLSIVAIGSQTLTLPEPS
jgi:alpha-glucosidase (family GH31 glycosyl hydrolase)